MQLHTKLKEYVEENGLVRKWVAKKIGISDVYFCNICGGKKSLPLKYWKTLIDLTNGFITLEDLMEPWLHKNDLEIIKISKGTDSKSCKISLK